MPKSKHRKKRSKGSSPAPPPPRPKASPRWVPYVGVGLLVVAVAQIIVTYLTPVPNWTILVGFLLMAGGLVTLSQVR